MAGWNIRTYIVACLLVSNVACHVRYRSEASKADQRTIEALTAFAAEELVFLERNARYRTLDELRPASKSAAGVLKRGEGSGFVYPVRVERGRFAVSATPLRFPASDRRSFYIDETSILRARLGDRTADRESPVMVVR